MICVIFGTSRSFINLLKCRFFPISLLQVFDALDRDLASSNAGEAMRKVSVAGAHPPSHDTPNDRELEKLKQYTQETPDRRDFEKAQNPPVLPPHLLQVYFFQIIALNEVFSELTFYLF